MTESGERGAIDAFLDAVVGLDFGVVAGAMSDEVVFRALVPPGFREAQGSVAAAEMLGGWFEDGRDATLLRRESGHVGDRVYTDYRIRLVVDGVPMVAEQKAIATVRDGKIATLDFLCSGFHAAAE